MESETHINTHSVGESVGTLAVPNGIKSTCHFAGDWLDGLPYNKLARQHSDNIQAEDVVKENGV